MPSADRVAEEHKRKELGEQFAARFSLRHPAVRASALSMGSYGASQVLRLGSNLILTRLLMPEAFGLMLIVNLILLGLQLCSDLGLGPALIHSRRGEDTLFLRTAWTINVIKGVVLWAMAALLAWPLAQYFGAPELIPVLPVAALTVVIDSLASAQTGVLRRRLELGKLYGIELGTYALGVVVMVVGALFTQTVWPLVIGSLLGACASTLLSHTVLGGPSMRFTWDRAIIGELIRFGRWLFISSILTFLAGQLDRIILGGFLTTAELGIYSLALMFSQFIPLLVQELSRRVLFPVYARAAEESPQALRRQVVRFRLSLLALALPPLAVLAPAAPFIIRLLYDARYYDAGPMLQILAIGAMLTSILAPVEQVLLGTGDSLRHLLLQLARSLATLGGMLAGAYFAGLPGLIWGFALSPLLYYPVLALLVARYRVWLPLFDCAAIAAAAGLTGTAALIWAYIGPWVEQMAAQMLAGLSSIVS